MRRCVTLIKRKLFVEFFFTSRLEVANNFFFWHLIQFYNISSTTKLESLKMAHCQCRNRIGTCSNIAFWSGNTCLVLPIIIKWKTVAQILDWALVLLDISYHRCDRSLSEAWVVLYFLFYRHELFWLSSDREHTLTVVSASPLHLQRTEFVYLLTSSPIRFFFVCFFFG